MLVSSSLPHLFPLAPAVPRCPPARWTSSHSNRHKNGSLRKPAQTTPTAVSSQIPVTNTNMWFHDRTLIDLQEWGKGRRYSRSINKGEAKTLRRNTFLATHWDVSIWGTTDIKLRCLPEWIIFFRHLCREMITSGYIGRDALVQ